MNKGRGRLESIWVKRFKRGPMDPKSRVDVLAGRGIVGNANQGGKRQITVISAEVWKGLMSELGADVDPFARRANLMVSGIDLSESRGRVLEIGDVHLRIHGETKPCERMEEAHPGLKSAMASSWRGGAYGEVLNDGTISVGDSAVWIDSCVQTY